MSAGVNIGGFGKGGPNKVTVIGRELPALLTYRVVNLGSRWESLYRLSRRHPCGAV